MRSCVTTYFATVRSQPTEIKEGTTVASIARYRPGSAPGAHSCRVTCKSVLQRSVFGTGSPDSALRSSLCAVGFPRHKANQIMKLCDHRGASTASKFQLFSTSPRHFSVRSVAPVRSRLRYILADDRHISRI